MADVNKALKLVLNKDMDRKEFLARSGAAVLAVSGVFGLYRALTTGQTRQRGYGSSAYGGGEPRGPRPV